jgi:hypothetical protein
VCSQLPSTACPAMSARVDAPEYVWDCSTERPSAPRARAPRRTMAPLIGYTPAPIAADASMYSKPLILGQPRTSHDLRRSSGGSRSPCEITFSECDSIWAQVPVSMIGATPPHPPAQESSTKHNQIKPSRVEIDQVRSRSGQVRSEVAVCSHRNIPGPWPCRPRPHMISSQQTRIPRLCAR